MAHWDAYYESNEMYAPMSTTISCGASHFNPGDVGDDSGGGHAVANASGAFAHSRPQFYEDVQSHYHDLDTMLPGYGSGEEVGRYCLAVCVCVCVCVCVYV